ncbi:hypothetical protein HOA59_02755 [archaeon]|jgi:ribosomal protein S24E|nr:hypothetical protein [archaeon]MBT6824331.1 hypothetical protein [archaeon]MBT7106881.1 hypothetical protein [archaeon]MBT7297433.1 hypothetical protein [archaeon]
MEILQKSKSTVLSRTEIVAKISHIEKKTPSKEELKEALGKELKTDKNLVVIDGIYTEYGKGRSKVIAKIYESKEMLRKIERIKGEPEEEKKETSEEQPKESPKEEVK